ncbi:hypothetical protein J3R82DRAFT_6782 [Butyriboletus roseoflavus]|nr:hypothetical protein J3R82DRAFT_6782 [Butyriboletus roseoflavus]
MATVHKQDSAWCSNYRVHPGYAFNSDSDSDTGCAPDADAVATADTNDMREMDLSRRHETVEYHPNPWSIARINAASRSSLAKPAPIARTPGPARPPPKPQPKPIVEAFKKQAKRGQPIVRDIRNPRDNSIGTPGTAKKSRQGCDTKIAQVRVYPQRTELLDPPAPAHKPHTGSAVHEAKALEKEKSAHIPTFFDRSIQSAHVPPPFKPRRIIGTHRAARSSPVRLVAPQSTPVRHAAGDRPTFHHSSPGPRSHVPVTAHIMRPPLPPLVSAPACMNSWPTKISNDLSPASPRPCVPGDMGQGTVPSWLVDALNDGIYVSPPPPLPLVPEPRQDATKPLHIRTLGPKHKRLASPGPTTPRKKPRASASASRPPDPVPPTISAPRRCPTAYTFGEDDDPDAEWSTLVRTKRRAATPAKRVGKPGGVRQSGCFRLPLPGLSPRTPTRAPEAKRRVITYLPPPMTNKKRDDEVTATVDPPTGGTAKHVQVAREEEETEIRVMDSDVTLVNEDEEHVAGIDVDDVCVRYPTTRAYMKAVRVVFEVVGTVLMSRFV